MNATQKKKWVREMVGAEKKDASRVASAVWELAEPPFQEVESSKRVAAYLAGRGFKVTWPIKSVPTAFKAEKGKGKPVIGMLGEYDALPDCGAEPGTYGHACGHHLLGVAPAAACVALAKMLEAKKKPGRVVYWGCPAEEALAGKVYMARDGAFRGLDACLTWHPSGNNRVRAMGGSALDSIAFEFFGKTAHAGGDPESGRSALDAALLMDVAVNYLREHVPENVRIHCVITDGGNAPNVVPGYAKIWYYVRCKDREQVDEVTARVIRCAKGAALATETTVRHKMLTSMYSRLRNQSMAELMLENMLLMGAPKATAADKQRVAALGKEPSFATTVMPTIPQDQGRASTDDDTVSWLAPMGGIAMACVAKGTVGHHREYTAQSDLPFAHKGMMKAAEVLAGAAWDLMTNAKVLKKAKDEFKAATKGFRFDPLIPKNQRPPIDGV
jgi:aminobenzoyl-glutamate utilization protein B